MCAWRQTARGGDPSTPSATLAARHLRVGLAALLIQSAQSSAFPAFPPIIHKHLVKQNLPVTQKTAQNREVVQRKERGANVQAKRSLVGKKANEKPTERPVLLEVQTPRWLVEAVAT